MGEQSCSSGRRQGQKLAQEDRAELGPLAPDRGALRAGADLLWLWRELSRLRDANRGWAQSCPRESRQSLPRLQASSPGA